MLKIKELRKNKKMTQSALADASGIKVRAIQSYEAGERYPSSDKIPTLSRALGVTIGELFGEQAKQEDTPEAALVEHVHQTNLVLIENMEADHRTIKTLARAKVGDLGTDIVRELVQLKDTIGEMIDNQIKNERRFMGMVEKSPSGEYITEMMGLDKKIGELEDELIALF